MLSATHYAPGLYVLIIVVIYYRNSGIIKPVCCSTQTATNTKRLTHSTIDATDVELFSKQMKEWWNPDGPLRLLHTFNLLRYV